MRNVAEDSRFERFAQLWEAEHSDAKSAQVGNVRKVLCQNLLMEYQRITALWGITSKDIANEIKNITFSHSKCQVHKILSRYDGVAEFISWLAGERSDREHGYTAFNAADAWVFYLAIENLKLADQAKVSEVPVESGLVIKRGKPKRGGDGEDSLVKVRLGLTRRDRGYPMLGHVARIHDACIKYLEPDSDVEMSPEALQKIAYYYLREMEEEIFYMIKMRGFMKPERRKEQDKIANLAPEDGFPGDYMNYDFHLDSLRTENDARRFGRNWLYEIMTQFFNEADFKKVSNLKVNTDATATHTPLSSIGVKKV